MAVLFKLVMKYTQMLKKSEFKKVYSSAKSLSGKTVIVLCVKNNMQQNRLGIVASKKTGNSVKRNKARRRIKEIYRMNESNLLKGYDIIIIAKAAIHEASFAELHKAIIHCFKRFKIWENNFSV